MVTCDHPAISDEDAGRMYWSRVTYNDHLVEDISQEQYLAANGINATIVSVNQTGRRPAVYEATFFANGASYSITSRSSYADERAAEAKEHLIEILDSFIF